MMRTVQLPRCTITVHDSPRTLPQSRWVECQYYRTIHKGIGSTLDDLDQHFDLMGRLVGYDDIDVQLTAINNTRFLFANILGKQISPNLLAMMCLVEEVDGHHWTDYSPEGLEELVRLLAEKGLASDQAEGIFEEVYRKLYAELSDAFPDNFPDNEADQISLQQRLLVLQIDELIDPDNPTLPDQRSSLAYDIQESIKPPVLTGPTSQLKAIRDMYVSNKIALQMEHLPVDDLTPSFSFWQYLIAVDKKYKATIKNGAPE